MRKFGKASLFALVGVALAATAAMASPASAAVYTYLEVNNDNTRPVTAATVTWSGSYSNQITGTINPMSASGLGKLTAANTYGTSFVDLTTDDGNGNTCYFTVSLNNSTGAVSASGAETGTNLAGTCTAQVSGSVVLFHTGGS